MSPAIVRSDDLDKAHDALHRLATDSAAATVPPAGAAPDVDAADRPAGRCPNQTWAELMRSFGFDVLACPRCAGRLKLVALIQDGAVIRRIHAMPRDQSKA